MSLLYTCHLMLLVAQPLQYSKPNVNKVVAYQVAYMYDTLAA